MSILIFIAILLVLVVSHEFGHFIVAKKSGIRVDEFSFGFPPKLFGKKVGETTYNFNLLPFGGYVKIFGQGSDDFPGQNGEEVTEDNKSRSFSNKPRYIQAGVLIAGVVMNFLVAWLLLSVGYMSGLPSSVAMAPEGTVVQNQYLTVTSVVKGSPAEIAGLETRDKLLVLKTETDRTETPSAESVKYFIKKHGNESITVEYMRDSLSKSLVVTPINNQEGVPTIGIAMDIIGTLKLPIHKAVWEGLKLTTDLTIGTAVGFYKLIAGAVTGTGSMNDVTGPIGIVGVVGDAAKFGFIYLLSFTALISVNLAVINLLPFPALDGGRLLFLLIEKIKGSRIKPEIANVVNMVGFGILMLLMVFITYHDIVKLI
ncbi:MAG: Membrane-associated zinc metalloprotease [Candidatus Nomurabacteria bacterium GW2011_GWF2_35_66]|uniref:Zinc metalloprotease n=1 Tax=Candidatus Nomurabacteria bacterium GW2011_GWE1_35_16 TaxID=1618761 RepID=A0A0G0B8G5_9BACT|nr:MAG: Membrane-associated zinc metalloprotease [Candidatus Nomurabacteria bacterium GW2011_GWF1_34_20]KKP63330.1 MAG: Membrane-associated zinc metalloprotease [Candidatus Nomurabacteria bacterium GW2011_GWE2_34_25]KKP65673.1 MAG: Membrane-associated zinc metalloprotease [Candidatus Nomurabacteria bacterium GW2011_GWE1_35_16]KKP83567.1 MAG: Membrane-associated zinc metalloprotease [Candidatus Nomurabacteria bacterium GW2011_GWF2_35_66]HAE36828.1 RIP metalloprotease RseP [Candidatus Nomurabacte